MWVHVHVVYTQCTHVRTCLYNMYMCIHVDVQNTQINTHCICKCIHICTCTCMNCQRPKKCTGHINVNVHVHVYIYFWIVGFSQLKASFCSSLTDPEWGKVPWTFSIADHNFRGLIIAFSISQVAAWALWGFQKHFICCCLLFPSLSLHTSTPVW